MQQGQVTSVGDGQALLVDVETLPARAVPAVELVVNEDIRKTGGGPGQRTRPRELCRRSAADPAAQQRLDSMENSEPLTSAYRTLGSYLRLGLR